MEGVVLFFLCLFQDIQSVKSWSVVYFPSHTDKVRLFAVAHHQRLGALRHAVLYQRHEVVPLLDRGVLEFVDQKVSIAESI